MTEQTESPDHNSWQEVLSQPLPSHFAYMPIAGGPPAVLQTLSHVWQAKKRCTEVYRDPEQKCGP